MFSKRVKIFFNIYLLIKFFCHCRLVLNPSFAGSSSGFGNGFLLTPMASNGLTYANVVDGAPGVVQNIFLSVLNGSKFLHETSNNQQQKVSCRNLEPFSTDKKIF